MSLKKFGRKLEKAATNAAITFTIGGGAYSIYKKNKNGINRFLGKEDRRAAKELAEQAAKDRESQRDLQGQALDIAQQRRDEESAFLQSERDRYNTLYKPIEQRISGELSQGPNTAEAAGIAGADFANNFDASVDARERDQLRRGVGMRPGSSAMRMQGENDAYNRARGIATMQTQARREEDDAHFLRSTAFYNANGSGIKSRLQQGMATMYGADYGSRLDGAKLMSGNAELAQQHSAALNEQSYAGVTTLANIAGQIVGAKVKGKGKGAGTGGTGGGGGGVTAATQAIASTPTARNKTPITNTMMNDYQTNQTKAAGVGALQSEINQGFGRGS